MAGSGFVEPERGEETDGGDDGGNVEDPAPAGVGGHVSGVDGSEDQSCVAGEDVDVDDPDAGFALVHVFEAAEGDGGGDGGGGAGDEAADAHCDYGRYGCYDGVEDAVDGYGDDVEGASAEGFGNWWADYAACCLSDEISD